MDEMSRVFGLLNNQKLYYADPHDMERAKRWGKLIYTEKNLGFYYWKGTTYVAPLDDPPMLKFIKGGKD